MSSPNEPWRKPLENFVQHLNQAHPTIKFIADWSPDSVSFLDITVTLRHGKVQTASQLTCTNAWPWAVVTHGTANKLSHMAKH